MKLSEVVRGRMAENWRFKMQAEIAETLKPFDIYGNGIFIPQAVKAIMKIARKYAQELLKEEHPD